MRSTSTTRRCVDRRFRSIPPNGSRCRDRAADHPPAGGDPRHHDGKRGSVGRAAPHEARRTAQQDPGRRDQLAHRAREGSRAWARTSTCRSRSTADSWSTRSNRCTAHAAPIRVLAIDDDETMRFMIRRCLSVPALRRAGGAVGGGRAGDGSRRSAGRHPAGSADARSRRLREPGARCGKRTTFASIPVVIVTSVALDNEAQQRLLAQADALLSKSDLSRETLRNAIRGAVSGRRGALRERQPIPLP